jgi:hypothetical protein
MLSLFLLYVVGINVFLSTSLFDTVVNGVDPVMLHIDYRKGWSIIPGRIHAEHLTIRSSDSNVEWILSLDEVDFDVSFLALARQRFDVSRAEGRGISMRARQKLDAAPESAAEVAHLPPIAGYPAFSVRPAGPPSPERWDDAQYRLWTVRLENVVAEDVREVWIDGGRFEGNARITGRFYLKPIRDVEVGPAHVAVREGKVTYGPSLGVAKKLAGSVDLTIDRFDPRAVPDNTILRHITLATELDGALADLGTLPLPLPASVSTEIDIDRLALKIDRGVLANGTRIDLSTGRLGVAKRNLLGRAAMDLRLAVVDETLGAKLSLRDVSIARSDDVAILSAPRIAVSADARALDLATEPFRDARIVTDLPHVELADARLLDAFIPKATPLDVRGGTAKAQGTVTYLVADHSATGSGHLHGNELDVRLSKLRVRGSFDVLGSFTGLRWSEGLVDDMRVSAAVTDGLLASHRDPAQPKVAVGSLFLDARAANVDLVDPLRAFDASFEMTDASIADVGLLRGYLPKDARATARFGVEGRVTVAEHRARGRLHARTNALGVLVGDVQMHAQVDAQAKVHDWDWERGDLAIDDALVDVSGLTLTRSKDPAPLASIDRISVRLASPTFAFTAPFQQIELAAVLDGGRVADATVVDGLLPDGSTIGLASDAGTFEARGRFAIKGGIASGKARVNAKHMGVRTEAFAVDGDARLAVDLERWDLDRRTVSFGPSHLALREVHGRFGRKGTGELSMNALELAAKVKDLDLAKPSLRGVDARLVVDDAELPDARSLAAMLPDGSAVRIESGSAYASGAIEISSSTNSATGTLDIDIQKGGIALNQTTLVGNFGVRAKILGYDADSSTLDISGSRVTLRDVKVAHASAETTAWRGDAALERATVCFGSDQRTASATGLDAVVKLDADNAKPVLGVLLRDSVPKFLVGLADMPRLEAYARVRLAPHAFVVSDVSASGGDVAVRGAYAIHGEDRSGAFVVEKGPFSVGLGLEKDGVSPRFFNLDVWLAAQEKSVKAKAPRVGQPGQRIPPKERAKP